MRFCIVYRTLNSQIQKDQYPLPNISGILDLLGGKQIFSTLDLRNGFWQLSIAEDDQPKTEFTCHMGLFQCKRVPFGLCNAPAFFQRTMDTLLTALIGVSVFVYLDDIIVFSKNNQYHIEHRQSVFDRIRNAGLRLRLEEVKLLSYIVDRDGIKTDPEKVQAISRMTPPIDVRDVRRFLGMTGFYRTSLPNYAKIAEPLIDLTRKNVRFNWLESHQKA